MFFKYVNGVKKFRFNFIFDIYGYATIFGLVIIWYLVPFGRKFLKWYKKRKYEKIKEWRIKNENSS
jgi:hypothetical protein